MHDLVLLLPSFTLNHHSHMYILSCCAQSEEYNTYLYRKITHTHVIQPISRVGIT